MASESVSAIDRSEYCDIRWPCSFQADETLSDLSFMLPSENLDLRALRPPPDDSGCGKAPGVSAGFDSRPRLVFGRSKAMLGP